MRHVLVCVTVAVALACSSSSFPTTDLGTWSAQYTAPGQGTIVSLRTVGDILVGDGSYAIEAGPSGTLQVSGTVHYPGITMVMRRDTGLTQTFTGTFLNVGTMTGTVADTIGGVPHQFALTFLRLATDPP